MNENMRLHWRVEEKIRPLDSAVKLEHLSFNPKSEQGKILGEAWLHISQSGMEFADDLYNGALELRWPTDSDNPFEARPICQFSIEEITNVTFHRSNDPKRPKGDASVFIEAKVEIHWHLFLETEKNE